MTGESMAGRCLAAAADKSWSMLMVQVGGEAGVGVGEEVEV